MFDFNDAVAVEQLRHHRGDSGTEHISNELWGESAGGESLDHLTQRAANACTRYQRLRCRGMLWLITGASHTGKKTVFESVQDEMRVRNPNVGFFRLHQIRPAAQLRRVQQQPSEWVITREAFAKQQRQLDYSTKFTWCASTYVAPLSLVSFLAEGGMGATAVVLGPPTAYAALRECLPRCSVGVLCLTCSPEVISQRWRMKLESEGEDSAQLPPASLRGTLSRPSSAGQCSTVTTDSNASSAVTSSLSPDDFLMFPAAGRVASAASMKAGRMRASDATPPRPQSAESTRSMSKAVPDGRACDESVSTVHTSVSDDTAFAHAMQGIRSEVVEYVDNDKSIGYAVGDVLEALLGVEAIYGDLPGLAEALAAAV